MSTKLFDQEVLLILIEKIKKAQLKKTKETNLKLDLKENNIIKAINPEFSFDLLGGWNGYGYDKLGKHLQEANYKPALAGLKKLLKSSEVKNKTVKKELTPEQKIEKWAARLAKLTGISQEAALDLAWEKIEYALDRLEVTINADYSGNRIPAWLRKGEREYTKICGDNSKALDRIRDEGHARAILAASRRHKESDYEDKLEEAKELMKSGELDREAVQDYARKEMRFN